MNSIPRSKFLLISILERYDIGTLGKIGKLGKSKVRFLRGSYIDAVQSIELREEGNGRELISENDSYDTICNLIKHYSINARTFTVIIKRSHLNFISHPPSRFAASLGGRLTRIAKVPRALKSGRFSRALNRHKDRNK